MAFRHSLGMLQSDMSTYHLTHTCLAVWNPMSFELSSKPRVPPLASAAMQTIAPLQCGLQALTLIMTLTLRCSSLPLFPLHLFLSTPTHRPPQTALLLDRWSIYRISLAILHSQQQGEKL